jgi:hypothetical protein
VKNLIFAGALLGLLFMLAGCQGEQSQTPAPSLPLPQVRVDKLPTATLTATSTPEPATTEAPTPTAIPQAQQVQPMPTRDDEAFWLAQIETLLDRNERRLNSLDKELRR